MHIEPLGYYESHTNYCRPHYFAGFFTPSYPKSCYRFQGFALSYFVKFFQILHHFLNTELMESKYQFQNYLTVKNRAQYW